MFLLKKAKAEKKRIITENQILQMIVEQNSHETELECRHCYSLYIGKCMENGVTVTFDAPNFYAYIQKLTEGNTT